MMKVLKNLSSFFTFSVFVILIIFFLHPIPIADINNDLGRHLLLGKIIVTSGHVPLTNLLSYTFPNFPFINSHWLSEVIFYVSVHALGLNSLIFISVIVTAVAFLLLFSTATKSFKVFPTTLVSLIYLMVLSERTQIRPEMFSFLLLAIFIVLLYNYKKRFTNWIFALIPLELFWVNLHIYFFVGIGVLGIFLIDEAVVSKGRFLTKKFLTLLLVTLVATTVTLVNPNFLRGATFPSFALQNYGFSVEENANFLFAMQFYKDPTFTYFIAASCLLVVALIFARKKMSPADLLLSLFFLLAGISAVRNFPLFVFGTFIPCAKATSYLYEVFSKKHIREKIFLWQIVSFVLICIAISPLVIWNINNHGFGLGVIDHDQDAVSFFIKNNLRGPIYNNFDAGNYLAYRLYPHEKVFVDGRPEAYPRDFFQNIYYPMQTSPAKFAEVSKLYGFNTIFFNHTDQSNEAAQLLTQLLSNSDWKIVYLDGSVVIFLKNSPQNQKIIHDYTFDQDQVHISDSDLKDKDKVRNLANFFQEVEWTKPELAMDLHFLDFEPKNCQVLRNVLILLQQKNDPTSAIYSLRFTTTCQ